MIQGLVADEDGLAADICAKAFERGLVMETAGVEDQVAKVMPPLTIEESVLDAGLDIIEAATIAALAERAPNRNKATA